MTKNKHKRGLKRKIPFIILATGIIVFLIYLVTPLPKKLLSRDYSQVILAKDSTFLRVFLNEEQQWCLPPSLQPDIPENLKIAILTFEDQHFYRHPGVNPIALVRALYLNIKHQQVVSGGSTITMQLARMLENNPRTIFNKLSEIFLAVKLELHYSKEEILNDYLAHAPFGANIRGYLAASHRFFGKKPNQLTWGEAATLAVLPNAPSMIFPSRNNRQLEKKRNVLLLKLYENNIIDLETYELSLLEKTPNKIIPFPLASPHLTDYIHSRNQLAVVHTSIDQNLQYETNFFVKQHAAQLKQMGVMNLCAIVVDNQSGKVASYVGSQDYNDLENEGRVNGIISARSSGSILKPYLYALAIDEGLILPQTLIKDVPTYFSSFAPSNASESFSGISTASKALVHSLNIPAVRLLNSYGVNKFYNLLEAAGVQTLFRTADDYGLPLILGGAEVTPWDMAKLYMGMANAGNFQDISYLKAERSKSAHDLVSSGSTYLILDQMKELIRPGLEFYWKKYSAQEPIAWKTGTSYGHKDAWAAGVTPKWTIIVWAGNFDGTSNKSLSGMRSAGPLLFNILKVLPKDPDNKWFKPNLKDFVTVKTCDDTGFYASEYCEKINETQAPVNMKPLKICPYHTRIYVDKKQEFAVCSHCWSGNQISESILKYSPDVNYYLRKNGSLVINEAVHNPSCPVKQEHGILQIIYPINNANLFVTKDFDGTYQPVISRLATQFPEREIFWYLDESLVGTTVNKSSIPLKLRSGNHTLTAVDTEGNRDQVKFSVRLN